MIVPCVSALLLLLTRVSSVKVDYFDFGTTIVQTQKPTGEFLFNYGDREILYVDLDSKKVEWALLDPEEHVSFPIQGALQNINVMNTNLNIWKEKSRNTTATSIEPEANVYTEHSVVLGEPNVLICFVRKIFPPVMNMTWLKNGEKIIKGVTETIFLTSQDYSFRKFLYLAFVPTPNDIYTCEVEHWGLSEPKRILWSPDAPSPQSETVETVICALGLFVGFIGVIAGIILLTKGMKLSAQQRRRGN